MVEVSPVGVDSPSFNVSCMPDMNCRTLPVLKRLDQDARDELEVDRTAPANESMGDGGGRGTVGEGAGIA